ncbi:MAG: PRC-barrel domain-containing protein [Elainellaceae cyanobacterium]
MYKGREIIGKPVVSYDAGEKFDIIVDLIFDQDSKKLLGFLVQESGWFKRSKVLQLKDVKAIGVNAVVVTSKTAIANGQSLAKISQILEHNTILKGTHILTVKGQDLGVVADLYFDERTGNIEGYEVSGGLFADAYSGRSFVPALQTLKIGRDVAFVPTETAQLMEEQVGGLRAAMQTVSGKFQETAQLTGDRLNEFGHTAGEQMQQTAQLTGDRLNELGRTASEQAQETAQITGDRLNELSRSTQTSITNAIINPEAQTAFVIDKTVDHDISTPAGEPFAQQGQTVTHEMIDAAKALGILDVLYRAAGGSLSNPLGQRLSDTVGSLSVEQAQGRRVHQAVRNGEGSIIAASGKIVTTHVIEQAKINHQEPALLKAVGLSSSEALHDRTSNAMTWASDRVQTSSHSTGEKFQAGAIEFQAGAMDLWSQFKEMASGIQTRNHQATEERQIKRALGRPVTRVILDQDDQVILNVGELITHQAIASARQAQVLDLLLSSVYSEKPQLSIDNLRAPQSGTAALEIMTRN